jgi:hypothetical protein
VDIAILAWIASHVRGVRQLEPKELFKIAHIAVSTLD